MKKKIINMFVILLMAFALVACGQTTQTPDDPNIGLDDPNQNGNGSGENGGNTDNEPKEVEFVVSMVYNKKVFIPEEAINVIWTDGYSQHTAPIGEDGYAKKVLDGEFNVYLDNIPSGYTYNPNIYKADNENNEIKIELLKISKITVRKDQDGTELYKELPMSKEGTYRTVIEREGQKVYYAYSPVKSGYYVIESYVNVYDDLINPMVDIYTGSFAYRSETYEIKDDGGQTLKGGYTKNFKWVVNISADEIGNSYFFGIYGTTKTGVYPFNIDFRISYEGEYYREDNISNVIYAQEANFKTPNFSSTDYQYITSDGCTGSYYGSVTNGTGLLDGKNFKYNEETGYWHVYDVNTNTFGPILCAKISKPCAYLDESFNMIEYHGNKNLTVSNGTENYKQFIENEYTLCANSDGVCYVTMELKEFLQKYSVSQRLFFDGNGFVETTGVYAIEEDQWLFACGYYQEV
jgi:hypothetical protein